MSLSLGGIRDEQNSPIPQHHAVVVRGFEQHSEPLPHVEVVQTTDAGSLPSLAAFSVSLLLTPPPLRKRRGIHYLLPYYISYRYKKYWNSIRFLSIFKTTVQYLFQYFGIQYFH